MGIGLAAIFLYLVAAQYFFIQGVQLNVFAPPLSLLLAFFPLIVLRAILSGAELRRLTRATG